MLFNHWMKKIFSLMHRQKKGQMQKRKYRVDESSDFNWVQKKKKKTDKEE